MNVPIYLTTSSSSIGIHSIRFGIIKNNNFLSLKGIDFNYNFKLWDTKYKNKSIKMENYPDFVSIENGFFSDIVLLLMKEEKDEQA